MLRVSRPWLSGPGRFASTMARPTQATMHHTPRSRVVGRVRTCVHGITVDSEHITRTPFPGQLAYAHPWPPRHARHALCTTVSQPVANSGYVQHAYRTLQSSASQRGSSDDGHRGRRGKGRDTRANDGHGPDRPHIAQSAHLKHRPTRDTPHDSSTPSSPSWTIKSRNHSKGRRGSDKDTSRANKEGRHRGQQTGRKWYDTTSADDSKGVDTIGTVKATDGRSHRQSWEKQISNCQNLNQFAETLTMVPSQELESPSMVAIAMFRLGRLVDYEIMRDGPSRAHSNTRQLRHVAQPLLRPLYTALRTTVSLMTPDQLGMTCASLNASLHTMDTPPAALCRDIEARAAVVALDMEAVNVRQVLQWFGWNKTTIAPKSTLDSLLRRLYNVADDVARPKEWLHLIRCFGSLQAMHPGLFKRHGDLRAVALNKLPELNDVTSRQFLHVLRSLTRLKWGAPELSTTVMRRFQDVDLEGLSPHEVVVFVWTFASLGLEVEARAMEAVGQRLAACMQRDLAAAQNTSTPAGRNTASSQSQSGSFRHKSAALQSNDLGHLLWAYGTLKVRPSVSEIALMQQLAIHLSSDMSPKDLSNVLWGLASLAVDVDTRLVNALINRANTHLPDPGHGKADSADTHSDHRTAHDGHSDAITTQSAAATRAGYWLPATTTILWSLTALNALSCADTSRLLHHVDYLIDGSASQMTTSKLEGSHTLSTHEVRKRYNLQARVAQLHATLSHIDLVDALEHVSHQSSRHVEALRHFVSTHPELVQVCNDEYRTRLTRLGAKSEKTGAALGRIGIASHAGRLGEVLQSILPDVQREAIVEGLGGPYLVDYYSPSTHCIVELNGPYHYTYTYRDGQWVDALPDGTTLLKERRLALCDDLHLVAITVNEMETMNEDALLQHLQSRMATLCNNVPHASTVVSTNAHPTTNHVDTVHIDGLASKPVREGVGGDGNAATTTKVSAQRALAHAFDVGETPLYKCSVCGQVYMHRGTAENHVGGRTLKWDKCAALGAKVVGNQAAEHL
eukprot:m.96762 g.96762  ORF g.96762 m.96762 type:complete len:1020 (+) comp10181_c0_seq4:149-3208(+)